MTNPLKNAPHWLTAWMAAHDISLWGAADLRAFATPADPAGNRFPRAVAFAIPMNPDIMASIQNGPNKAYADEYARVNNHINAQLLSLKYAQFKMQENIQSTKGYLGFEEDFVKINGYAAEVDDALACLNRIQKKGG